MNIEMTERKERKTGGYVMIRNMMKEKEKNRDKVNVGICK